MRIVTKAGQKICIPDYEGRSLKIHVGLGKVLRRKICINQVSCIHARCRILRTLAFASRDGRFDFFVGPSRMAYDVNASA